MGKREIAPVKDNKEKEATYRFQMGRYKLAIKNEFYFEAMMIVYGMLEDRLRSFLYHAGALANRNSIKVGTARTKVEIKQIVATYKRDQEKNDLGISNISGKRKIVRAMLMWAETADDCPKDDRYMCALKNRLKGMSIGELIDVLDESQKWCDYRNEVIHALMNKNIDSLYEKLAAQVQRGMELARFIDSQTKLLKKGNIVRRAANLSI